MGQSRGAQEESATEVLPDLGRLALTCWDYAWPLRREYGPGGGAVERALDDAVERGFNAVRLDPYPHLLATPANSVHLDRCEIFAEPDARLGMGAGAETVQIRKAFRRLLNAAADRGLNLWLSGFFIADSRARRSFVRRPADFIDVWAQTLELVREWGHLDSVVAVDFCHHFPFPPWGHGVIRRVFGQPPQRPLPQRWAASRSGRWSSICWKCRVPCVRCFRPSISGSAPPPVRPITYANWTPANWIFWNWGCGWTTIRATGWPPAPTCRCPVCSTGAWARPCGGR